MQNVKLSIPAAFFVVLLALTLPHGLGCGGGQKERTAEQIEESRQQTLERAEAFRSESKKSDKSS